MKRITGLVVLAFVSSLYAASPPSVPIFSDNFESGTMNLWTVTSATTPNPLTIATPQNVIPAGGQFSAYLNVSADRMHHNIIGDNGGADLSGHILFTFWIYDQGTNSGTVGATRLYNEIRGHSGGTGIPNGGTAVSGALAQLLAAGKFNSTTLTGEVFTTTKYQGRVAFGPATAGTTGWFNLNDPGSPNRSIGWHRFDIEVMPGGTAVRFYVDEVLSRTFNGAAVEPFDTVILGPGVGTQAGDAWFDGISIGRVDTNSPVINCPSNIIAVATSSSSGAIVNYPAPTATDDLDTSPTIVCNPPSGSLFPVGTTTVVCTATDDAGNIGRCTFQVTVLPLRFEGFEHWAQGQAVLTPESNRLRISNLGSGGNDGWRLALNQVDASIFEFYPWNYLTETCAVTHVDITVDGAAAQLHTELLVGQELTTLKVDFEALGSRESDVQVRDGTGHLLQTYRIPNASRIDINTIFPGGCNSPVTVYNYSQDTNSVWYRFCKAGCGPCIGTNCWIERVICLRAIALPHEISLKGMDVRAQGMSANGSLLLEDLKFMKFGNEHHSIGDGLVDGEGGVIAIIDEALLATDIPPAIQLEISPGYVWKSVRPFAPGVNGIGAELKPVDSIHGGAGSCIMLGAEGMFNGLPAVQLGTAALRTPMGKKMPELSADFRSIGASMVVLEVLSRGQMTGQTMLPNGVLGHVTGDGMLIGVADAAMSPGTFQFLWDAEVDVMLGDGSVFKGDEFRIWGHDPQGQIQGVGMLSLHSEGFPSLTILGEALEPTGEQFFPKDVMPPPTASWESFPTEIVQFPTPNQGGLAMRKLHLSFFDMSFDPPKQGEQVIKEFRCILDEELSRGIGWNCVGFQGTSEWRLMATQPPDPAMGQVYETEMLSLNLVGQGLMIRESPTLPSRGQASIRMLPAGGDMISSFFDIFLEISLDGGQTWMPAEGSVHMELGAYAAIRSPVPNLPPGPSSGAEFDMQCPEVAFANQAVIRNVHLMSLQQGPSLVIPLGGNTSFPVNGAVQFEFSPNGQTFQTLLGQVQGTGRLTHSFNYPESGEIGFYDTEMLQLELIGGAAAPIIVRKSPAAPLGPGRSCLGRNGLGEYLMASFFDVNTEISLDGGRSFSPATRPARFTLANPDGNCLRIICPETVRGWACTATQGGVVNYTVTATSLCGTTPHVTCNPPSGSVFPVGSTTVTCTATDEAGNTASCTFKVDVILDTTPPQIVCPDTLVAWACSPNGGIVNYPLPTATDDCDTNVTVVCNPPSGTPFPPGSTTVTCTARDDCDHVSTCQFRVVVRVDTEPPRLTCPQTIEVCTCNPNGTNVTYGVSATDDCDTNVTITCTPPSGSFFPPGTNTVTCTAEDDCGHKSECSFLVIVRLKRLAIQCPPDITVLSCSNTPVVVTYNVAVSNGCAGLGACIVPDNGTGTATLPPNCPYLGERMMIINGLPPGTTIELAPVFDSFTCQPGAPICADCFVIDNCNPTDGETLSYRSMLHLTLDGTGAAAGYHRMLTIADMSHQQGDAPRTPGMAVQSFNADMLQLQGQLPPGDPDFDLLRITAGTSFGLPSPGHTTLTQVGPGWAVDSFFDITYRIDFVGHVGGPFGGMSGSTTGTIRIRTTGGGSGGTAVVCNPPSGSSFPVGTTTVTCRATNECGFSDTCQFKVTVVPDLEPPKIVCPSNIVDWTCSDTKVVTYTVTATDDTDPNVTIVCNPPSGSSFPVGITTVTCVATDDCGKTDRCQFTVRIIRDTAPPVIHCPTNPVILWVCTNRAVLDYTVTATDDCDTNVTIICNPPPGTIVPAPTNLVVTCVAIDDCQKTATCQFDVRIIRDTTPPVIHCPTNAVVWTCTNVVVLNYTVTATDDCDTNVDIVCNPPPGTVVNVPTTGVINVSCTARDDCGNTSGCQFQVRVIRDTQPPTIICPNDIVVQTCRDCYPVNYRVEVRDDCDTNVDVVCNPPPGTCFPLGTNEVRCIAIDDCGNRSECKFQVIVLREQCPPLTIRPLAGAPGWVICWPAPSPGCRLQCTKSLNPPIVWENVTNTPVLVGGTQWCVFLPHVPPHRFYRLCKPCDPVITGVSHLQPREGDVITINGSGFGTVADDLCVVIAENSLVTTNPPPSGDLAGVGDPNIRYIPLRALFAQNTFMTARMGPVPPDVKRGRIMVGHGIGHVGRFQPAFQDIVLVDPVWVWQKFGPAGMGDQDIDPQPNPEPTPNDHCFFSGPPENGALCVFIQGDWGTNCYISIIARAHDSVSDTGGYDLDGPTIRFINGGNTAGCAARIADVIRCAFAQQAGVTIEVSVEEVPPGSGVFKITVRIPGGYIDRGMLTICVRCANP
jgi:hypothetical protein